MQTILIPTDFKPRSLEVVHTLCQQLEAKDLRLVFTHMFKLSDSISDLLMLSRRSREYEFISEEFYAGLKALKQECGVKLVKIEFFYGSTLKVFKHFLESNEITHILDATNHPVSLLNKASIHPSEFIHKCGIPLLMVEKTALSSTRSTSVFREQELPAEV